MFRIQKLYIKIWKANDNSRMSRFHSLRGVPCPIREYWKIFEYVIRFLFGHYTQSPWINIPAIKYLTDFMKNDRNLRVLEIGSGASTLFFLKLGHSVCTIENSQFWADRTRSIAIDYERNLTILDLPLIQVFESDLLDDFAPNLIFIDSGDAEIRASLLNDAIHKYPKSRIVLDNSDRIASSELKLLTTNYQFVEITGMNIRPFQVSSTLFLSPKLKH